MGSKTKEWERERRKLKKEYEKRGIVLCELRFDGCYRNNMLSFAHRYKRGDPRCEHTFKGTVLACIPCHQVIEYNKELTEEVFKKLRDSVE
jgi:hypothetical protein